MLEPLFDRAFDLPVQIIANESEQEIYSLTSARIYSSAPTTTQIADTTGALADYTAKSTTLVRETDGKYKVTFAAITDPDPTDTSAYETYYCVFSVVLQSGGTAINRYRPFLIYRGWSLIDQIQITATDIFHLDSELKDLKSAAWVEQKIAIAQRRLLRKLRAQNIRRADVSHADLIDAVRFLTASYAFRDLKNEEKATAYQREYEAIWSDSPPAIDADDDNIVSPEESRRSNVLIFER